MSNAYLEDFDGDGWTDLAVDAAVINSCGQNRSGVGILSTKTGTIVRHMSAEPCNYNYVFARPAGDWNGDQVRDYLVNYQESQPPWDPENHIHILSGADDSLIISFSGPETEGFSSWSASDVDLNGDGRPDVLISAKDEPPAGAIHAYDTDGNLLYKASARVLGRFAVIGDVDADGTDDFAAVTPGEEGRPWTRVFSGSDGRQIAAGRGTYNSGNSHIQACGDVNFDGIPDYVTSGSSFGAPGAVAVFAGATAEVLYSWTNVDAYGQGLAVADYDLDGVQDILVGVVSCNGLAGGLEWRSLRDGSLIRGICRPPGSGSSSLGFGNDVFAGPPQPGHPSPLFLTSQPQFNPRGRVLMYRSSPASFDPLGGGCTGSLPDKPRLGLAPYETKTRIHLSNVPAESQAALMLGVAGAATPYPRPLLLDALGFPGCALSVPAQISVPVVTDATGYAFVDIPLVIAMGTPSLTLEGQWLVLGLGALAPGALSDGFTWGH